MNDEQFPAPSDPPPWIVSQPPPPPGHRPSHRGPALLVVTGAAIAVLLILGAGGAWWLLRDTGPDPAPPAAGPPPATVTTVPGGDDDGGAGSVTPPVEETVPQRTADPERMALDRLEELARDDLAGVALDGRYVAQLASKYPGIHDPLQTTAAGSHTFRAADILDEHERLRGDPANGDARVVLLRSDTYGRRQLVGGAPLYVTFALGDFSGAAGVRAWCAARFPDLSAAARENQCAVRRLRPPA